MAYELRKTLPKDSSELQMKFESKPIAKTMEIEELELSLMNLYVSFFLISVSNLPRSGVLVQLRFGNWDQSDTHAVSIHKVFPDHLKLMPNEKKFFKVLVFGRRKGYHKLDALKILNLANNSLIKYERPNIQIV